MDSHVVSAAAFFQAPSHRFDKNSFQVHNTMETERSHTMGDKGGKKDKQKTQKQKVAKKEQQAKKKQDKQPKSTP